ncbi:MAG: diacylglycerol kinase [Planctomycetota bacterium]|jgi:diacylglycerol kinase (ATP)|nr:diacylglycerol kinase [Planctomycetota bacterium]
MIRLLIRAPRRFKKSFGYSWDGLKAVFVKEESFRLESMAFIIVFVLLAVSSWPIWKKLALIAAYLLVPLAEIFNSAIEDICDGITHDRRPFIKAAKDKGALAVLMAIVINVLALIALMTCG